MASSKKPSHCPICQKPIILKFRPFCSQRCKMIDLGHWLKGTYAIPSAEEPSNSGDPKETEEDVFSLQKKE